MLADFFNLLRNNRKGWMLPLALVLFVVGVFMVLTSPAPFIYAVF